MDVLAKEKKANFCFSRLATKGRYKGNHVL